MTIIRIGLDTSKHVFQIHGVDENEQPVLRRQIRRQEVAKFFAKLAPTRIGLEACGGVWRYGGEGTRADARAAAALGER
jgi:transposase